MGAMFNILLLLALPNGLGGAPANECIDLAGDSFCGDLSTGLGVDKTSRRDMEQALPGVRQSREEEEEGMVGIRSVFLR